jgi:hypothetical protein
MFGPKLDSSTNLPSVSELEDAFLYFNCNYKSIVKVQEEINDHSRFDCKGNRIKKGE